MTNSENTQIRLKECAIGPSQLRAARGMLGWSRGELAKEAGLSAETIKNIEHSIYSPKEETIKTLVDAFARRGIQFVQNEAVVCVPASCGQKESTLVFSHIGIFRTALSVSEIKEIGHD